MALEIIDVTQAGRAEDWQAYVTRNPNAGPYHALEWRDILLRTFGHRSWYLMARSNGEVRGVLPLIEMRSWLFGHFFVSLPFLDYGGIVAETPDCEAALAAAAVELAGSRGAHHVELRQWHPLQCEAEAGWKMRQHKVALVIPLRGDPEKHWNSLSSRLRGKVRKAARSGAVFSIGDGAALDDFYRVFSRNMRDLGTPVYSRTFFCNILRCRRDATLLLVRRAGQAAAAAIALRHGETIELPWICSDYTHASFHANEFLYWNAIEWACSAGARALNLGRCSVDGGTYRFKMQWNPDVRPLSWYYWLAAGTALPELSPSNPKYALAVRCWRNLPLALANRLGPRIVRNIP